MKRRSMLRVMLQAYVSWLNREMQPAGKAALHTLEARGSVLIDALPTGPGGQAPDVAVLETLDARGVEAGMGWLLTAMRVAYPDEWAPVAVESLRLLLAKNVDEVAELAQPPASPAEGKASRAQGGKS